MPKKSEQLVSAKTALKEYYDALFAAYGPQKWWPGETGVEMVIGAFLTQNTNWKNVEKAIARLHAANLIDWTALRDVPIADLAELVRPAGYYKARRLKNFVTWLWSRYDGDLKRLRDIPLELLRNELLSINGVGPETADAILLYALHKPSFVIDAYATRLIRRHNLMAEPINYDLLKKLFEENLPRDAQLFNEYHALIVQVGKRHCRTVAQCEGCPLSRFEHDATK